jgi:hypothetical protein
VGADNQAERVIARIEFRKQLADIFIEASGLSGLVAKSEVLAGIVAVLNTIERRTEERWMRTTRPNV